MAAASSGAEDGWLTRFGDGTKDFTYNNYFRTFGTEQYISDMNMPVGIHYDETTEKIYVSARQNQFADNSFNPSGQAMDALWRFNSDGTWDNSAQQSFFGTTQTTNDGFSISPVSSNRLMLSCDKGNFWTYYNTANNAPENATKYAGNAGGGQISNVTPVKMGNDTSPANSYVGIARYSNNTRGAIVQYSGNLLQTGQRRKPSDYSNTNGARPVAYGVMMAGSSKTNWFFLSYKFVSGALFFGIVKCNGVVPQSAVYIPDSYWSGLGRQVAYARSIACDSSGNPYVYYKGTDNWNYIVKLNSSLAPQKCVTWMDTGDTRPVYYSMEAHEDGYLYLQTALFRENVPRQYLKIDQALTSISGYCYHSYLATGSNISNSETGDANGQPILDSRGNMYITYQARFDNITIGGQAANGDHSVLIKIPSGGLATGTYDLSGGSSYFADAELEVSNPAIPTVSTITAPTMTSFTYGTNTENTGNTYYEGYTLNTVGNRLANVSFDRRNYPIS